ncbi:MAG TPA: hypothetical protein VF771_20065, partial [Longimicrobiaceae bacterium]
MRRLLLAMTAAVLQACATAQPRLVISHVAVVDVDSGVVRPEQTVVIGGRHIERVAPAGELRTPRGARVVDGRGKFLLPG